MARTPISKEEMLKRVAVFKQMTPSARPLVDAALPEYHRQIFNVIGRGVTEDATMKVPITAVDGFHMAIIKCEKGKGTGLHDHKTVEVFMVLQGTWAIIWGDNGENEVTLNQWDTISVPPGVMRGFRHDGEGEGYLLGLVGGDDPGSVMWADSILKGARAKGFDLDSKGKIVELAKA